MKVLIIEDEAPAFRRLNNLLNENHNEMEVIDVLDSVSDSLSWFANNDMPDLIFSDIQLADGLSFEIYGRTTVSCPIIFTTAYDEYMLEAFKTNGIDYLLKPIDETNLARSIEKFRGLTVQNDAPNDSPDLSALLAALDGKSNVYKSRFLVKVGAKLIPLSVDNIAYFHSNEGATEIVTTSGKTYIIDPPLDELERSLDPQIFFRFNRKILGKFSSVQTVHQYFKGKLKVDMLPSLDGGAIISRDKARAFKDWMDGK